MSPQTATAARHRTGIRRGPASRTPRRVSGPTRPRAVHHGGAVALPRPQPRRAPAVPGVARRALRGLATLPEHRLLDRLLTGSGWIAIVGFALIGIVFMQVSLLKLNAGIGASVERASTLERQNSQLREIVSQLGSTDRIQAEAQRLGLVVPPAGAVTFLGADGKRIGGDATSALAAATAADATAADETSVPPATQPTAATPEASAQQQQPTEQQPTTPAPAAEQPAPATQQPTQPTQPAPAASTPAGTTAGGAAPPSAAPAATAQQP